MARHQFAESLISKFLKEQGISEGTQVTKRKGTKSDASGWSGNVPDLIWDISTSGDSGGEAVWFLDPDGEGEPDLNVALIDAKTDQYIARPTTPPKDEMAAERIVQVMIKAINAAVAKSSADDFLTTLRKMTPAGWQVIG